VIRLGLRQPTKKGKSQEVVPTILNHGCCRHNSSRCSLLKARSCRTGPVTIKYRFNKVKQSTDMNGLGYNTESITKDTSQETRAEVRTIRGFQNFPEVRASWRLRCTQEITVRGPESGAGPQASGGSMTVCFLFSRDYIEKSIRYTILNNFDPCYFFVRCMDH